ncbi:MAG: hypothetical protein ACSHWZ_13860 [Sulfitobacter sp.]
MNTKKPKYTLRMTALAFLIPVAALAQQNRPAPPEPDLGQIASALHVSERALENCMPARSTSGKPERPNAAKIADCLKGDNGALTAQTVNDVFGKYAPKPPRG